MGSNQTVALRADLVTTLCLHIQSEGDPLIRPGGTGGGAPGTFNPGGIAGGAPGTFNPGGIAGGAPTTFSPGGNKGISLVTTCERWFG